MDGFEVRPAQAADAAQIARLSGQLGYPCEAGEMVGRLRQALADDRRRVFVADAGAGLLGWVAVEQRSTLESGVHAEIVGFVVDARARRGGIGRHLLEAAERWARERGFAALTVRSNAARIESHPFYGKHGYRRTKTQHVYIKALR